MPPKVLAYIEKHAPEYLTLPPGLAGAAELAPRDLGRVRAGRAAGDAGYDWKAKGRRPTGFKGPPTGLGRKGYA